MHDHREQCALPFLSLTFKLVRNEPHHSRETNGWHWHRPVRLNGEDMASCSWPLLVIHMAETACRHTYRQDYWGALHNIQLFWLAQDHTHRWRTPIPTRVQSFGKSNSIQHELASAHNLGSNGLAEAAVKNLKAIVIWEHAKKANLDDGIAAWRHMARADRISPGQLSFNRLPHQKLPILFYPTPANLNNSSSGKTHAQPISNQNTHAS